MNVIGPGVGWIHFAPPWPSWMWRPESWRDVFFFFFFFSKKKAIPLLKKKSENDSRQRSNYASMRCKAWLLCTVTMHSWHRKSPPSLQSRHFQHALLLPLQLQHPFWPRELPKPSCWRSSSKQVWQKLSHSLSLVYVLIRKSQYNILLSYSFVFALILLLNQIGYCSLHQEVESDHLYYQWYKLYELSFLLLESQG